MSSQYSLLKEKRFAPFFTTQFLGAMNDNVFKVSITSLITYQTQLFSGVNAATAGFLISAIFIAPFVLFSATSGQLADRYDKARLMQAIKALEIFIMCTACAGFWLHDLNFLYLTTFLLGLHSTMFGPVKFAYLPQVLDEAELTGGNGLVEMGTFVAILIGTLLGGIFSQWEVHPNFGHLSIGVICLGIAAVGYITSLGIPKTPALSPNIKINWNPLTETWRNLALARETRSVFLSLLGISWLWFFGATFLTSFFNFSKDVLGGNQEIVTLLLVIFSMGIAIGSLLCERLSGNKIEIGLVPFGSIGMTIFAIDLYFASRGLKPNGLIGIVEFLQNPRHYRIIADLFLLSLFSGLFSVPLYALIQARSLPSHRARIIGANNILNAIFMISASLMGMFLLGPLNFNIPEVILITGILNALVAIYIFSLVPEFLMRFLAWSLIHTFYKVRTYGIENIPKNGAALLTCNHVSYADAVILMAISPRPIRFIMDAQIFSTPILGFIFKQAKAIPISSRKENPELVAKAFHQAAEALSEGELVGIFPEGKITTTGDLNVFRSGFTEILKLHPAPLIPMALQGMWGSFFARHNGRAFSRFRGIFSPISVQISHQRNPENSEPHTIEQITKELRGNNL